jgi:hypothetical protein
MENVLGGCRYEVDMNEVSRMMGYPAAENVSESVQELCFEQIRRLEDLLDPWGGRRLVRIEGVDSETVRLEVGRTLKGRRLASILRRATNLEVCIATVGARVTAAINDLVTAGAMVEALALDAAASVATTSLMTQLRARVCGEALEQNCGTTLAYGPGFTGWRPEDTTTVFALLEADPFPVRLNEQLMMIPQKSLLNVMGIEPGGHRTQSEVVPCRLCDLVRCSLRQAPYRPRRARQRKEEE